MVVDPSRQPKPPRVQRPASTFGDWLCGAPRDRVCGRLGGTADDADIAHFLLRKSGEGLVHAGRRINQAVQDASSAATLAVDDLNRHTLERVRSTVEARRHRRRSGATRLEQRAPTVYARLRPMPPHVSSPRENRLSGSERIVRVSAEHPAMAPLSFVLDGVIGADATQEEAYAALGASAVERLLEGESSTLIAFGAEGAGKSYSLFGPPDLLSNPTGSAWQDWGLLPRASHHLFSRASAVGGIEGLVGPGSSVSCSFIEIADGAGGGQPHAIHDLLGKGRALRLRESAAHGVHVPGATTRLVEWEEDVMRALVIGLQKRSDAAATAHTLFTLTLHRRMDDGTTRDCALQVVDIGAAEPHPRPGSARPPADHAREKNASLTALNRCINALAEGREASSKPPSPGEPNPQGIPYRDSYLTWLLRDALGGNAGELAAGGGAVGAPVHNTTFLVTCSPEPQRLPTTINSLRFAHRCRQARVWTLVPTDADEEVALLTGPETPFREGFREGSAAKGSTKGGATRGATRGAMGGATRGAMGGGEGYRRHLESPMLTGTMSSMRLGVDDASDSSDDEVGPDGTVVAAPAPTHPTRLFDQFDRRGSEMTPAAVGAATPNRPAAVCLALTPPAQPPGGARGSPPPSQPPPGSAPQLPTPSTAHPPISTPPPITVPAATTPRAIDLAQLSERAKEELELRQRLAAVQAQVQAEAASPPPIQSSDSWEQLQSAQAHMLLLEARLAELSQA